MFETILTERLTLRHPSLADLDALVARRSDPEVARYQDWVAPYPRDRALSMLEAVTAMDGPVSDEWFMLTVVETATESIVGDLAIHPTWSGRAVEVGYTFAREHWGKGYAYEAVQALIDRIMEDPKVTRVHTMMHPDNVASVQVSERCGLVFEGHTRNSYWVGDENSDDYLYGMTREGYDAWRDRPTGQVQQVELAEITRANLNAVRSLATHKSQERLASPVLVSLSDALIPELIDGEPVVPWFRAIVADGEVAGFVMLSMTSPADPVPFLWRLMVDRRFQRRGIGTKVLDLVVAECKSRGDTEMLTSWVEARGTPAPLYLGYGFERTGNIENGEVEGRLVF